MNKDQPSVLIVDDDSEIRDILFEFLSRSYDCVALDCAESALALLALQTFDVILSDITMAQMNGLEMVRQVIRCSPDSVIIMISGQRTIEFAIEAMRAGAFDYITKPFDLSEVAAVLTRALKQREPNVRSHSNEAFEGLREIAAGIDNHEFIVHYQPQVEIESRRLVGVEALLRWQHPQRGLLSPAEFIPFAEESGAIVPLGEAVLQTTCAQTRHWQDRGFRNFRVAVNVSPQQLREADFPEAVARIIRDAGLRADRLELEVTETSFMNEAESGIRNLIRLREMGVKIAIDDFGTGYSSLSYLKRLPVDSVKLDASFVKNATDDPDDAVLVMSIITLAHNLRLRIIAEGIEKEEQLAFLRLLRCDEGQGYLLGKPASAEDLAASWLSRKTNRHGKVLKENRSSHSQSARAA